MFDPSNRQHFLSLALLAEGGLVLVAFLLNWATGAPTVPIHWEGHAVLAGLLATVPMFCLFVAAHCFPLGPLAAIKRFLIDMLGPSLATCRHYDLVILAALAGFCEEILFRGVLLPWMGQTGEYFGLIGSSIVFGLAHLVTVTYAILAALFGIYLGILPQTTDPPNLLVPIVTHAVYDYLAFLVVLHAYRNEQIAERLGQPTNQSDT